MPMIDITKPIKWYKDGLEFIEKEIKELNPNVSFGVPFSPDGYEPIFATINPATSLQVGTINGTEIDNDGNRVVKWVVRDKTEEELAKDEKIRKELANEPILAQISIIEAKQARPLREAFSADEAVRENAMKYLKQYSDEIIALRGQLL